MATEQTYTLDGPTEFFFPFSVRTAGEVVVELVPGGVLPPSEYEVIGASATATGITVRYPNAPRDGSIDLTITRVTSLDRVSIFLDDLSITATALNAEFDNIIAIVQDGVVNEYKGEWVTNELFLALDVVLGPDGNVYVAAEQHTSDVFATDLSNGLWNLAADFSAGQQAIDTSLQEAEDARDKAEQWAEEPEDSEVETGQFSALHHAAKSADSATAASNSATAASNSASAAANSATNASNSATAASNSATAASNSASAAATSEQNASDSETAAANSASAAATSEQNASDSETAAANSESAAATSEQNAANSATAASNSASAAATSASNASDSETAAANSATAAQQAEAGAEGFLEDFDERYLGAKATEPSTDNSGDPLVAGTLFYDTSAAALKIWDGSAWVTSNVDTVSLVFPFFDSDGNSDTISLSTTQQLPFVLADGTQDNITVVT